MDCQDITVERHIDEILDQLGLEEKVRLLNGADFSSTHPCPAIGLRAIILSDGPAGVRGEMSWDERDPSFCVPSPSALAATWDEALVARVAEIIASDARRKGVHVVLAPTLNLHRSPLGGRHFECFSEDPLLTGRIGAAYVCALQSFGVGATPKHYVANDSETDRFTVDVQVDQRTLRELYLAPFELAVDAGAWLVMAAYNSVNGVTMTEHALLTAPLKSEWAFDGVVVSDWTAVRSTEEAATAGTDLAMPGPSYEWDEPLVTAVQEGRVPEALIDEKVRRILRLAGRVGAIDGIEPPAAALPGSDHAPSLLQKAAASAMVLLRNENQILPLNTAGLRRLAVIGPNAAQAQVQGGGSARVVPPYAISPLDSIREAVGDRVHVLHSVGVNRRMDLPEIPAERLINPYTCDAGVSVRFLDAGCTAVKTENRHAARLMWLPGALAGIESVELRTRLRAAKNGAHHIGVAGPGPYRLEVDGMVLIDDVIKQSTRHTTSACRTAEVNLTQGEDVHIVVTLRVMSLEEVTELTLGLREEPLPAAEMIMAAAAAAATADAAVVVVGTSPRDESEGLDRTSMALPDRQNELVQAVAAANPHTIVVVNSGAPVDLPWHTNVAALLLAWFPGQEFGHALADVLFGAREPGGRLPTTWAIRQEDVPVLYTRPVRNRLDYREGLHVGYRALARIGRKAPYPFGYGLGYTTWAYRSVHVPERLGFDQPATARVRLANTGDRVGREVVQIYLRRPDSGIERPALWLAGFAPVTAEPGQEVEATIHLAPRAFQHWSAASGTWVTESGTYMVEAGRSSADLPLKTKVRILEAEQ